MIEVWKPIENYDEYEVSNHGRVRRWFRSDLRMYRGRFKILKPGISKGYYKVELYSNKVSKTKKIHRLVAKAFILNPENKPEVNHIDGNPLNNHISNLEWVTQSENGLHAYRIGLSKKVFGKDHKMSKKVYQFTIDGKLVNTYWGSCEAARLTGFDKQKISRCARGYKKSNNIAFGYRWSHTENPFR